ncbi:putative inorganic phosphate cotransporter [Episyrphus balteatus]|uniref:putative inorganic phosphate cotransporter n=1 Tax=Episyrphus balteatus TaxID=286459 RepID=UPI002484E37E|nr:putative inorganic phosphate cotransporter [Episyrphus balteatus]
MTFKIDKGPIVGVRHVQVVLLFLGYIAGCMIRLNVSIAVVAMTNAKTSNPDFPEYDWNTKHKSYIISSIYWGFIIAQPLAAMVCRRFGAKITMTVAMVIPSLLCLMTPESIPLGGWQIYCAIRFVEGLFQGMYFPSIYEHITNWSPVEEITRLGSMAHGGLLIGTILAMMVSGFVAKSSLGWPGISYVSGGIGIIWCVLWIILADNFPSNSRFIGPKEKSYIISSKKKTNEDKKRIPIPWKSLLTSIPCLSLKVVIFCQTWTYTTMVSQIPLYMRGVLKLDIKNNALFSGLPFLAMFIMTYVYLISMEFIMKKNIISLLALRKTITSLAMWVPSITLLCIGFLDETQKMLAIVLLVVTVGASAGQNIGTAFNAIDLSPNHSVVIMGIIYIGVSFSALLSPLVSGIIVKEEGNSDQWQIVFLISSVICFFGNLQYLFFGTDKTQPWNDDDFLTKKTPDCEKQKDSKSNQITNVDKHSK